MHGNSIQQYDDNSAWAWVRRNAAQLRTGLAVSLALGDKDMHLQRNRHMHALLDELNIPHLYKELPGVGHDAGRVYHDVGSEGFVFHAQHFSSK